MPNIMVSDQFYVHACRHQFSCWAILIGTDDSVVNEHSTLTELGTDGSFKECRPWPVALGDRSKANWMIRVVGTAMVAEQ